MHIHPLPTALHAQLVDAGVESFELNFDCRDGYLDVSICIPDRSTPSTLWERAVELWAEVYDYNFDISDDSGDIIVYDLTNGQVNHQAWRMERFVDKITQNLNII